MDTLEVSIPLSWVTLVQLLLNREVKGESCIEFSTRRPTNTFLFLVLRTQSHPILVE